jgi:hypothetical protein
MGGMFTRNTEFKGDLSVWDVKKVKMMSGMFEEAGIENSGIGQWDTESLTYACTMFEGAKGLSIDIDLSKWNTGNLRWMVRMFRDSALVDGGIGNWAVTSSASTSRLLSGTYFTGTLDRWPPEKRSQALQGVLSRSTLSPHQRFGTKYSRDDRIGMGFAVHV